MGRREVPGPRRVADAPAGTATMGPADWDRRWVQRIAEGIREPSRLLIAETALLPAGRALDLACGAGRNAVWLAEQGWRVTGVDFSPVALAAARQLAHERGVQVEFVEADVIDWEPPAGRFDLVCAMYLQLPGPDRRRVLRQAAAVLEPGGTLLVVAHDPLNLTAGYGGPSNPAVLYGAAEVVEDLQELELERAGPVRRPVKTPDGERTAIDLVVRARRPGAARA